jgi:acyl carrier protein
MDPVRTIPEHVLEATRTCIAESLAVDRTQIRPESRLIDDLGADSLDFVDIVFMLEQALAVRMRESELSFLTKLDFSSPEVMREGHLTREVVDRIEEWLPAIGEVPDRSRVTPAQLFSFITVEAICLAAARRLAVEAAQDESSAR